MPPIGLPSPVIDTPDIRLRSHAQASRVRRRPRRHTRESGYPVRCGPRSIISSSAILDRPPSRAMTRSVDIRLRSHGQASRVRRAPPSYPRKRVSSTLRPSIDHQLLCNTGSPAFAGDDTKRGHSPALACAKGRFCSPAQSSYPRKRVSSTPRPLDRSSAPLQYWIARLRGR